MNLRFYLEYASVVLDDVALVIDFEERVSPETVAGRHEGDAGQKALVVLEHTRPGDLGHGRIHHRLPLGVCRQSRVSRPVYQHGRELNENHAGG